jgi:hypothetical protein
MFEKNPKNNTRPNDLKLSAGSKSILLIAPHAPIIGKMPRNDRNTGKITEQVREALKCSAIINNVYRKPPKKGKPDLTKKRLDFNIIEQAKLHPEFLSVIKQIVDSEGKTLVVWIHGLADSSALEEADEVIKSKLFNGKRDELHALIGFGQGHDPHTGQGNSRYTATKQTATKFRDLLCSHGLNTIFTRSDAPNYRGRDRKRMNQWFRNEGYKLTQVESIQLEIREKDFRDKPENCRKAAKIIEQALSALIRPQESKTWQAKTS